MVINLPMVQLEDQLTACNEPLVFRPAMCALASQQLLIPTARRFDIANTNKRLRSHKGTKTFRWKTGKLNLLWCELTCLADYFLPKNGKGFGELRNDLARTSFAPSITEAPSVRLHLSLQLLTTAYC